MKHTRRVFLRNTALVGGAVTLRSLSVKAQTSAGPGVALASTEAEGVSSEALRRQFKSPAKKYGPIARWWWLGNDVDDAELRREMEVLDRAGFGGAEIQPFFKGIATGVLSAGEMQKVKSYATPSFFRHVGVVIEEARKRGMFIDYTFGSGWPFGGSEITPELAAIELRWTHLAVRGPAKFHEQMQIPAVTDGDPTTGADVLKGLPDGWAERMKRRTKIVAVVALRGSDAVWDFGLVARREQNALRSGQLERGTAVDLTAQLRPDGVLEWNVPEGTWQIFVFASLPTGQGVNGAAGEGPQLVMDHMSAEAFDAHAKHVGGNAIPFIGEFFGDGLRAIFCDSLEVGANLYWSDDFMAEFRRRRGYDLLPYLPILKVQSDAEPFGEFYDLPVFEMAEIGGQVRHDYRQTVSDLMIERFYEQFNQWAHAHNLLSRTQAHGAPADVLRIYGEADIPETETLYDAGCYDFLKMAASSAHVYGRSIVGSESFVWPTAVYETTPRKMKRATDELLTAGVNAIVYHGFPYRVPEIPAPGWQPFSGVNGSGNYSSHFNETNPFWPYFAQLNSYITRMQYISQTGTNIAAVALYREDLAHGAEESGPTPKLNQAILDAGYNYDHINANSLLDCNVREGMLITSGGAGYRALVLPQLEAIDAALAEKLEGFAGDGLPILFTGEAPLRSAGFLDAERETQRVQAALRAMQSLRSVFLCPAKEEIVLTLGRVAQPNVRFHGKAPPFFQKRIGRMNAYFLRNERDVVQQINAKFEAEGTPELWDPWNGEARPIFNYRRKDDWVEVELELQPLGSALIVFDPDAPPSTAGAPVARSLKRSEEIGADGWKLVVTGLAPSGETAVVVRSLSRLVDWSLDKELRGLSGHGVYTTSFNISANDAGGQLLLDLGNVKDVAEVAVNGKHAGTLLLEPYLVDISEFAQGGENVLEITVTNALFNSVVLRQPRPFRAGGTENPSGLMSSGLLGPVQLKVMS